MLTPKKYIYIFLNLKIKNKKQKITFLPLKKCRSQFPSFGPTLRLWRCWGAVFLKEKWHHRILWSYGQYAENIVQWTDEKKKRTNPSHSLRESGSTGACDGTWRETTVKLFIGCCQTYGGEMAHAINYPSISRWQKCK